MTQYAVAWRPDYSHTTRLIGPFRSEDKADAVYEQMLDLERELGLDMGLIPQVVAFENWQDVRRELIEIYGES